MVDPNIWGRHGWKFLHYVAQGYPIDPTFEDKKNYKFFLYGVGNILPCGKCQQHYKQHLNKFPISDTVLETKESLENWVITIHNQVNISNNKPTFTFEEARKVIIDDTCIDREYINDDENINYDKYNKKIKYLENKIKQFEINKKNIVKDDVKIDIDKDTTTIKNIKDKNINKIKKSKNNNFTIISCIIIAFILLFFIKKRF